MFRLQPVAGLTLPWKSAPLHDFPWSALPTLAGDVLAVMFVTVTNFLLNTTGIEIATRNEANVERDLKVLGLANVCERGARRLCELHVAQPLHPGPHRRRHQPHSRTDSGGNLRGRA